MKNFTKILMAVAALFAFSCTTDVTDDLGVQVGNDGGQTTLTLSLEASRTQLGEKSGELYPLFWSEGDVIAVNGVTSVPVGAVDAGKATTVFTIPGAIERPYNIVYPAPAEDAKVITETIKVVEDVVTTDPETGESVTTPTEVDKEVQVALYPVTFPATQNYTAGTFENGAAPMYGYADVLGEDEVVTAIQINHLTGVLNFNIKGSETLSKIVITSEAGAISGTYYIRCETGQLVAKEESTSNQVVLSFGDGLTLNPETATPVYVTIPKGAYGVFAATLFTTDGKKMTVRFDSDGMPISVGKVREFAPFTFAENSVEEGVFEIYDVDDLKAFAAIVDPLKFYPRTEARLMKDIDMTGVEWTPIEGFRSLFNGNDCTIKGLTAPLFGTTSASIKNLKLEDVKLVTNDAPVMGALACTVTATNSTVPVIEGCSVSGTLTVDNKTFVPVGANSGNELVYAGLVARTIGAQINNCVNNVAVTVDHLTVADDSKSVYPFVAGVVAYAAEFTRADGEKVYANVTNSTNSAAVIYQDKSLTKHTSKRAVYIGGIISRCAAANVAVISNNTNDAPITIQNAYVEHSEGRSMAGGIVARTSHIAEFAGNTNTVNGTLTVTGNTTKIYAGCVAGYMADAVATFNEAPCTITNCKNYADAYMEGPTVNAVDFGGFAGDIIYFNLDKCYNYGEVVSVKSTSTSTYTAGAIYVAGFIARSTGDQATLRMKMSNGSNSAAVTADFTDISVSELRVAGVTAYTHTSWNSFTNEESAKVLVKGQITSRAGHSSFEDQTSDTQITIGGVGGYMASTASYDCFNYADVEVDAIWKTTKASFIQVGGLTGRTHNKIYRGVNYGNVYFKGDTSAIVESASATISGAKVTCYGMTFVGGCAGVTYWDCANMTNEGNIYVTGNHARLKIGGCAGGANHAADNFVNKGEVNVNATYNQVADIGGCVGYGVYNNKGDVLNSHNYGKINVSGVQTAAGEVHVGGIAGNINGSHNKNLYNHKGADIYVNMTTSSAKIHVGGVMYKSVDPLTGAVNEGNITIEGKVGSTLYVGGVVTTQNGYNRTDLTNRGKITLGCNVSGSCFVGGICYDGQYDKTWKNCHNEGDIEFTEKFVNTANVRTGGLLGKFETAGHYAIFDGCSNSGNLTFNGKAKTYLRFGGLIGDLASSTTVIIKNGFTNSGDISFGGEIIDKSNVHLGGLIGCCSSTTYKFVKDDDVWTGNIVNTGTISATGKTPNGELRVGGFVGLLNASGSSPFMDSAKYYQLGDIVVTGDIGTGKRYAGGAVAISMASIDGVECYCNIQALNSQDVGFITGSARSASVVATNCKIGGNLLGEYNAADEEYFKTPLTASNYFEHIYGGVTDWTGVENYDGCTFLTSKPTIPAPEPALPIE